MGGDGGRGGPAQCGGRGGGPGTVLYCTVLHCTVLYCTVLYCTVLQVVGVAEGGVIARTGVTNSDASGKMWKCVVQVSEGISTIL